MVSTNRIETQRAPDREASRKYILVIGACNHKVSKNYAPRKIARGITITPRPLRPLPLRPHLPPLLVPPRRRR